MRSVPVFTQSGRNWQFPGRPPHTPWPAQYLFEMEDRDPAWAPAMESSQRALFSEANLQRFGLQGLRVTELTCRKTTCRLVYEFPVRLYGVAEKADLPAESPLELLVEAIGPPATEGSGLTKARFELDGEPHERISVFMGFNETSWDPDHHAEWVASQQPRAQRFFESWRTRQREKAARARAQPP